MKNLKSKNVIFRITSFAAAILLVISVILACKKDENKVLGPISPGTGNPTVSLSDCAENSGYFTIDLDGEHFELVVDSATQYTNLYNWFGYQESAFIINGKDQNANYLYVELGLPGKFLVGSNTYTADSAGIGFFDLDLDTSSLYVSNVTFNVVTSNLNVNDGIYRPLKASFSGIAHSYPWINGQAPADTVQINGTICLNGIIFP